MSHEPTPAELAAECRYRFEERIAILREGHDCKGQPTPEQVQIATDEVNEYRRRFAKPEQKKLI